jgi:phosphopantothenoylcysteine decarboxylase/phosphopantothenate--cysteine ligase
MGYAIAESFAAQGAKVFLVSGPVSIETKVKEVEVLHVTSAAEMFKACENLMGSVDVAVFNAAVADFTPVESYNKKVKRGDESWNIELKPTRDIAGELGKTKRSSQLFVGFALETDKGIESAHKKMARKNMDLMVLNSLEDEGAGFGTDTNKVTMIDQTGKMYSYELKPKTQVAADLVQRVINMIDDA